MLRLAIDEDVHAAILRGLLRREPLLDVVSVRQAGLAHTPDPIILEWAATEGRILVSADVNTMVGHAADRVAAGNSTPGLLAIKPGTRIGKIIDDILLIAHCASVDDLKSQVLYIPL
jgi:hypothetical protein